MNVTIAIATLVFLAVLWTYFFSSRLPRSFHSRHCQGREWKRIFPTAEKHEIRDFLRTFIDAFSFSDKENLKLNPDDQILAIYRSRYPIYRIGGDALELETFAIKMEKKYQIKLEDIWHEHLTLGELFKIAHS